MRNVDVLNAIPPVTANVMPSAAEPRAGEKQGDCLIGLRAGYGNRAREDHFCIHSISDAHVVEMMMENDMPEFQLKGLRARARSILFCSILLVVSGMPPVSAQEVTGGIHGTIAATASDIHDLKIVAVNTGNGSTSERSPDSDGKYSISGLTPGNYEVSLVRGKDVLAKVSVTVRPNGSAVVPDLVLTAATDLDAVTVSADKINNAVDNTIPIDVSTPVLVRQFSEDLLRKIGFDTSSRSDAGSYSNLLTQLPTAYLSQVTAAQGTGLASFNGGSGTETRYYVNEFDTTYDYNGAGASAVPGDMIGTATVIANGASAKYSNAMGGSVAASVKHGDNTLRGGVTVTVSPPYSRLFPHYKKYLMEYDDDNATNRYYYQDGSTNGQTDFTFNTTYWLAGPLVKDKLFFNVALETNLPSSRAHYMAGEEGSQYIEYHNSYKTLAGDLLWNISDNQQLELLLSKTGRKNYSDVYDLAEYNNIGSAKTWDYDLLWQSKDRFSLGHYTWRITDNLDLSVMAGYFTHSESNSWSTSGPYAVEYGEDWDYTLLANGIAYNEEPTRYRKRGYRADWTWQLGDHKLQFGAEKYDIYFNAYWATCTAGCYTYYTEDTTSSDFTYAGTLVVPHGENTVVSATYSGGGPLNFQNRGLYLEDYWQVADDVVLYAGLRRDNSNATLSTGFKALNLYQTSPRLGLSWDVRGDSTMKLGVSAGQYTLPVPGNLLVNMFNPYTYTYTLYTYDGINSDGTPVNPQYVDSYVDSSSIDNPLILTSRNLKNSLQDSYTVYLQDSKLIPNWSWTAEFNYSSVKRALAVWSDLDSSLSSSAYEYLESLGYDDPHVDAYTLINPGRDIVLTYDFNGDGTAETVTIPASATGLSKPKRETYSASFEFVHPETPEQPFLLRLAYTWKHSYGNYEGYWGESTGSELGSSAQRWAGFQLGSNGNLPSDVRHVVRINAAHTFDETGILLGVSLDWQSGAPKSCYSRYPSVTNAAYDGGVAAFYCYGHIVNRGSLGRLPSYWLMGLNSSWTHKWGEHSLTIEANLSNLLNRQTAVYYNPTYSDTYTENSDGTLTAVRSVYYHAKTYLAPRTLWLNFRYTWN
ncbi:MAG: hypothetical protein QM601_10745 [Pseudoxanthomonas sp.]